MKKTNLVKTGYITPLLSELGKTVCRARYGAGKMIEAEISICESLVSKGLAKYEGEPTGCARGGHTAAKLGVTITKKRLEVANSGSIVEIEKLLGVSTKCARSIVLTRPHLNGDKIRPLVVDSLGVFKDKRCDAGVLRDAVRGIFQFQR
jgi:hypothetical protein